jgi:hypothetical protein
LDKEAVGKGYSSHRVKGQRGKINTKERKIILKIRKMTNENL